MEVANDQDNISMCLHSTLSGGTGCRMLVYQLLLLIITHACMDSVAQ